MRSFRTGLLVALLTFLIGGAVAVSCATHSLQHKVEKGDSESTPSVRHIPQKILFEVGYVNFAWGYQHHGFYIDSEGRVYSYEYKHDDTKWEPRAHARYWEPAETYRYTGDELIEKYSHSRTFIGTIQPDVLLQRFRLIEGASKGKLSDRVAVGADMGGLTYGAYTFDERTREYRHVMLHSEGDWRYENLSNSGKALSEWLKAVCRETRYKQCSN